MADDLAYYRQTLHEVYEVPAHDDLVQGAVTRDAVELTASGSHKRGLLLMTGTEGFVPATSAGVASAKELCILCADKDIPEGSKALTYAYFSGTFSGDSIILGYETENDEHEGLIEAIRETLRQHRIFVQ